MMQNQSLFRGQVEPLLGRPTGAPNPIWSNQSNTTTQPPPPHPQLGFALGPVQPPAFNSFGLGPHGLFAPSLPTTAATVAQGPPAHAFGLGHAQSGGQSLMNSMQQEKGHTNKEKLKSKFFAERIWKTKYRSSCQDIFLIQHLVFLTFFGQINQYF